MTPECATEHMHDTWGINITKETCMRMRDVSAQVIHTLCVLGDVRLTPRQTQHRDCIFCTGCLRQAKRVNGQCFQGEFESYTKRVKTDNSADDESDISCQRRFTDHSTQTTNVILDVTAPDLDLTTLTQEQKEHLAFQLSQSEKGNLEHSIQDISQNYKSIAYWKSFDLAKYHEHQNGVVKAFLNGLRSSSSVHVYRAAKTVETILDYCFVNTIQPLHFMESLVLYCMTRSRTALQMISCETPHASYTTVQRWLSSLSEQHQIQRPLGDIIVALDNNQVLKKKWGIKVGNKCYNSVVTMIVAFEIDRDGKCEERKDLAPKSWRHVGFTPEKVKKLKTIDKDENVKRVHYEQHLFPYLSKRIGKVVNEQTEQGDQWVDLVDEKVKSDNRHEAYNICGDCGHENRKQSRKCGKCGVNLSQSKRNAKIEEAQMSTTNRSEARLRVAVESGDGSTMKLLTEKERNTRPEYDHIKCELPSEAPNAVVLTPSMVNPNSYDAIRKVLVDCGQQARIQKYCPESNRKFLLIYCDGVPYNLIWRLCQSTFRCLSCGELLHSKADCTKHGHNDFTLEFDWVVVVPGGGHIEMNMLKTLVELLWPVFWKDMVMLFNFTSEAALRSARNVSDHHKGWAVLSICRNAVVDELLVPYVRQKLSIGSNSNAKSINLSPKDYFKFLESGLVQDPNYLFLVDVSMEIIDSIFMHRAGIRSARPDLIWAGRAKFTKVWSARHHPAYRELNLHDLMQRLMVPPDLGAYIDKTMSLNMTGNTYTGESPDFRLEELNRGVQRFLPLSPSDQDWLNVCLNFNTLDQLRQQLLQTKGYDIPSSIFTPKPAAPAPSEELAVRAMFRKRNYLDNPFVQRDHVSVSGLPLSPSLVSFCTQAADRHAQFVDNAVLHDQSTGKERACAVKCTLTPVFITLEEQNENAKLTKRTRTELATMVENTMRNIVNGDSRDAWDELWKTDVKKKGTKMDYIEFLNELESFINESNLSDDEPEDDI